MDALTSQTETIMLLGSELPAEVSFLGYGVTTYYIVAFVAVVAIVQTTIVVKKYQKNNS